jgi:hypothetical protein
LLGPIGEVKESPKYHILGFMNNHRGQWEKYLRTRPKIHPLLSSLVHSFVISSPNMGTLHIGDEIGIGVK